MAVDSQKSWTQRFDEMMAGYGPSAPATRNAPESTTPAPKPAPVATPAPTAVRATPSTTGQTSSGTALYRYDESSGGWLPNSTAATPASTSDANTTTPAAGGYSYDESTIQGAGATGYEPTGYQPAPRASVDNYTAPNAASTQGYSATNQAVTSDQLASDQMTELLAGDSPYIRQARQQGLLSSHGRGMLNSSASAGAAQAAAVQAALPIAQQDAATYGNAAANYANAQNRAGEFGARESNVSSLQHNQQVDAARRFESSAQNLSRREGVQAENRANEYGASAVNRAGEFYASAENTASIQNANNELSLTLQSLRDDLSTYSTDIQRETALDNLGLNLFNTAMNSGVFNSPETIAGYFDTVSGIFPDLGIQLISQAADQVTDGVIA